MSYLNDVMGYRGDILMNRSVMKKGVYALLEPDGLVKNVIPGFVGCELTILSSPLLGASFVDYLMTVWDGGHNKAGFGDEGIEVFLYILEGSLKVWNEEREAVVSGGGYFFSPQGKKLYFENISDTPVKCFLYKRRYQPVDGYEAATVIANVDDLEWICYEGMEDVLIKNLLPSADDLGFDMNFHILYFKPGASHGYLETHIQEHGAYIYSGEGMYNLDNNWMPVKKGDYIFMGAYCLQAAYGIGRNEPFAYIYSKDCNRDVKL